MKNQSYLAYLLLFLVLGCQKPEPVEPLSADEILAQSAKIDKVISRTQGLTSPSREDQNIIDVNRMVPSCEMYVYDSQGRIKSERFNLEREQPCREGEPSRRYDYRDGYVVISPYQATTMGDTMRAGANGFITSVNVFPRLNNYLSSTFDYDENGFLVKEFHDVYQSWRESNALITLKHSYLDGNRIKTVMTSLMGYNSFGTPDSAVVVYNYDKTSYNPSIRYDDYQLVGSFSLGNDYFAYFSKRHHSLYGKPSKNLLKTVVCHLFVAKKPYKYEPERIYNYRYTFDAKKRVDSLIVTAKSIYNVGIHLRKFIYKE